MHLTMSNTRETLGVTPFDKRTGSRDVRLVVLYRNRAYVGFLHNNGDITVEERDNWLFHISDANVKLYGIGRRR